MTEQKAVRLSSRIAKAQKKVLAQYCDTVYPIRIDTVEGQERVTLDTIYVESVDTSDWEIGGDTAQWSPNIPADTCHPIPCRGKTMIITKRVEKPIYIVKKNTAEVDAFRLTNIVLVAANKELSEKNKELKTTNKIRFWIIVALASLVLFLGSTKLKGIFSKIKLGVIILVFISCSTQKKQRNTLPVYVPKRYMTHVADHFLHPIYPYKDTVKQTLCDSTGIK